MIDCSSICILRADFQFDLIYHQNAVILLLGTKEDIVETEPIEHPKFIEDMNEAELASAVSNNIFLIQFFQNEN